MDAQAHEKVKVLHGTPDVATALVNEGKRQAIGFDTETTGLFPWEGAWVRLVQLAGESGTTCRQM